MKGWHTVTAIVPNKQYRCARCGHRGTLEEVTRHVVEMQYDLTKERLVLGSNS